MLAIADKDSGEIIKKIFPGECKRNWRKGGFLECKYRKIVLHFGHSENHTSSRCPVLQSVIPTKMEVDHFVTLMLFCVGIGS